MAKARRVMSVLVAAAIAVAIVGAFGVPLSPRISAAQSLPQLPSNTPQWYLPINNQLSSVWSSDVVYAAAAVALSFAVAGLIYMVGVAAKSDRIRDFGDGELYEALASGIIVVAFLYVSAVVFGVVPGFVTGSSINPYATAFSLMLSTIQQAEALYNSLYQGFIAASFYSSLEVTLTIPPAGFSTDLFLPLYATAVQFFFIQPATTLMGFLTDAILVIYAEYYTLVFFSISAIPAFLVPGVVLRAIFPTRALGGMLIAMAMGFYLVVPTMFAIAFYFTAPTTISQTGALATQVTKYGSNSGAVMNSVSSSSPLASLMGTAGAAMTGFWLMILFYPMLIIAVAYAFIVQVANFIGGASNMSGRLRAFI